MGKTTAAADADGPGFVSLNDAGAAAGDLPGPADEAVPLTRWRDMVHAAVADPPEDEQPAAPLEWGHWRYTGHRSDLVYTAVPVTPKPGDVVGWWGPPGHDGLWEPTEEQPTRMPDNHRPDPTEAEHARLRGDDTN